MTIENPVYRIIAVRTAQASLVALLVHWVFHWPLTGRHALGLFLTPILCVYFVFVFVARWSWGLPILNRVSTEERLNALTFDDGPSPEVTPLVLDILRQWNVSATFFVLGEAVEYSPELLRRIVAEGHSVGIHGYQHKPFVLLSHKKIEAEIERTREAIRRACPECGPIFLLRPPHGFKSWGLLWAARRSGCHLAAWTVDSRDYSLASPQEIARRLLTRLHPGAIVLLHDGWANLATAEALPILLAQMESDGWQTVALPLSRKS